MSYRISATLPDGTTSVKYYMSRQQQVNGLNKLTGRFGVPCRIAGLPAKHLHVTITADAAYVEYREGR